MLLMGRADTEPSRPLVKTFSSPKGSRIWRLEVMKHGDKLDMRYCRCGYWMLNDVHVFLSTPLGIPLSVLKYLAFEIDPTRS